MIKSLNSGLIAIAAGATLACAAPAMAAPLHFQPGTYSQSNYSDFRGFDEDLSGENQQAQNQSWGQEQVQNASSSQDVADGQYCKKRSGTTGMIIGGVVGGVLGNQIAGRNNRTLGTIIGVVGGGLVGRAIDRGKSNCR